MTWTMLLDKEPRNLEEARQRMAEIQRTTSAIIKILTAEQALRAQKVVKEARRR